VSIFVDGPAFAIGSVMVSGIDRWREESWRQKEFPKTSRLKNLRSKKRVDPRADLVTCLVPTCPNLVITSSPRRTAQAQSFPDDVEA
jgi:hypothetical protein